jgi:hypothetical protein
LEWLWKQSHLYYSLWRCNISSSLLELWRLKFYSANHTTGNTSQVWFVPSHCNGKLNFMSVDEQTRHHELTSHARNMENSHVIQYYVWWV